MTRVDTSSSSLFLVLYDDIGAFEGMKDCDGYDEFEFSLEKCRVTPYRIKSFFSDCLLRFSNEYVYCLGDEYKNDGGVFAESYAKIACLREFLTSLYKDSEVSADVVGIVNEVKELSEDKSIAIRADAILANELHRRIKAKCREFGESVYNDVVQLWGHVKLLGGFDVHTDTGWTMEYEFLPDLVDFTQQRTTAAFAVSLWCSETNGKEQKEEDEDTDKLCEQQQQ